MKKLIARLFGLYTKYDVQHAAYVAAEDTYAARRNYYQAVLGELQRNGSLPPSCDLKMPKQSLVVANEETGEIIAEQGMWKRLPSDGEKLKVTYKPQ